VELVVGMVLVEVCAPSVEETVLAGVFVSWVVEEELAVLMEPSLVEVAVVQLVCKKAWTEAFLEDLAEVVVVLQVKKLYHALESRPRMNYLPSLVASEVVAVFLSLVLVYFFQASQVSVASVVAEPKVVLVQLMVVALEVGQVAQYLGLTCRMAFGKLVVVLEASCLLGV